MITNWQKRWHLLFQRWVIISSKTASRPWSGNLSLSSKKEEPPSYDEHCYLCPGNTRPSGKQNPRYESQWSFENDFPSLSLQAPASIADGKFIKVSPAKGICKVLCWSPNHNLGLAKMETTAIENILQFWQEEYLALKKLEEIAYILLFENKGKEVGTSNPHPHGQIYATDFIPEQAQLIRDSQYQWYKKYGTSLLMDLAKFEIEQEERLVERNNSFVAFVPFFAQFPFEVWIVPLKRTSSIIDLDQEARKDLAQLYQIVLRKYDALFNRSFPNITLVRNAPIDENPHNDYWQFFLQFCPPLRSQNQLKFLAGFETGSSNIVNPVQPEVASQGLRSVKISL